MAVRQPADWMTQTDERILEILSADGVHTPSMIADDKRIAVSRPHCNVRLGKLVEANLVEKLSRGVYKITEEGEAFLAGDPNPI